MTQIILIKQLPLLDISIKMTNEIIYQTDEDCAKLQLFPLDKRLTKQTIFNVSEKLIQIKFNSYQYVSEILSDGKPIPFYSEIYKNNISLYLDDDILDILVSYKLNTGRHFTEYLGKEVNTMRGTTVLHCCFNTNNNLGSNFRKENPALCIT